MSDICLCDTCETPDWLEETCDECQACLNYDYENCEALEWEEPDYEKIWKERFGE